MTRKIKHSQIIHDSSEDNVYRCILELSKDYTSFDSVLRDQCQRSRNVALFFRYHVRVLVFVGMLFEYTAMLAIRPWTGKKNCLAPTGLSPWFVLIRSDSFYSFFGFICKLKCSNRDFAWPCHNQITLPPPTCTMHEVQLKSQQLKDCPRVTPPVHGGENIGSKWSPWQIVAHQSFRRTTGWLGR